jgi:3-dehydroquinate dehydratase/shikimate dehydrogenase
MYEARKAGADLVEFRADYLAEGEPWERVVEQRPLPMIFTFRPVCEGGLSDMNDHERVRLLQRAVERGVEFVDVELANMDLFRLPASVQQQDASTRPKLIVSYHSFTRALNEAELAELYTAIVATGADICKIAMMCHDLCDNARLFDLLKRTAGSKPTIAIGMGEYGQMSRILAAKFGPAMLTFTTLTEARASAPGQLRTDELIQHYRFHSLNPDTTVYGVIGAPVSHSMSPRIHNHAFGVLRLNHVYLPFLVQDGSRLGIFLDTMTRYGLRGASVTIPHKQKVMEYLDDLDDVARQIGAVNTIVVDPLTGRRKGYNTDWQAALDAVVVALEREGKVETSPSEALRHRHVVLLGAGGAARAIAFGAVYRRCGKLTIINRTLERAQSLVNDLVALGETTLVARSLEEFCNIQLNRESREHIDILMNSTSIGMYPDADMIPIPKEILQPHMLVFDAIYNPVETKLLALARRTGCRTVDGVEMFVRQAAAQFTLWTGLTAPIQEMRAVVMQELGQMAQR